MHFSYFLFGLAATTFALPTTQNLKRDAQSIVAGISTISEDITTLNNTLNGFTPNNPLNTITVLKIQKQTSALSDSILAATSTAADSEPLDSDDSFTVAEAVLNLQPNIFSLLDNLQAKKPVFDKAVLGFVSVSKIVLKDLQRQKQLSAAFGVTVAEKLAEPFKSFAPLINGQIEEAFDEAIATYSS
jgi:hypothetical protein